MAQSLALQLLKLQRTLFSRNTINILLSFLQGLGAQASYSEVKEKEEKVGLPSQTAPKNPRGQMHLNAPGISVQVAPFLQGFDAQ